MRHPSHILYNPDGRPLPSVTIVRHRKVPVRNWCSDADQAITYSGVIVCDS